MWDGSSRRRSARHTGRSPRTGVDKLIADSSLGGVQRATQDPLGLARRLRMTG
jgi:hypothetical protein